MENYSREEEIFDSLQRMRRADALFGIDSGRGILGDMLADRQLAQDIASGMDVRCALGRQRMMDELMGNRRSNDMLADLITDEFIANDFESGCDLGEAITRQRFLDDLFD